MIRYRVTTLTRKPDGTDWAVIDSFDGRGDAARFAERCRDENPSAIIDVVAIDERGEVVKDQGEYLPVRTPASDAARDQAMATARDRNITHHINELPAVIEIPPTRNEVPQDPWGNSLGYRG